MDQLLYSSPRHREQEVPRTFGNRREEFVCARRPVPEAEPAVENHLDAIEGRLQSLGVEQASRSPLKGDAGKLRGGVVFIEKRADRKAFFDQVTGEADPRLSRSAGDQHFQKSASCWHPR